MTAVATPGPTPGPPPRWMLNGITVNRRPDLDLPFVVPRTVCLEFFKSVGLEREIDYECLLKHITISPVGIFRLRSPICSSLGFARCTRIRIDCNDFLRKIRMIGKSKVAFRLLVAIEQETLTRPTEPLRTKNSRFSSRGLENLGVAAFRLSSTDENDRDILACHIQTVFRIH